MRRKVRHGVPALRGAGPRAGFAQDAADCAGSQPVTESGQFALDSAVPPSRIFLCQAQNQAANLFGYRWTPCPVWVGPLLLDQTAVPGQECGRRDDAACPERAW